MAKDRNLINKINYIYDMNYWWVNHSQTFRIEIAGGFIWAPTKKSNGFKNQTYDNLKLAEIGDVVFSFAGQKIRAVGVVTETAISFNKPPEFGSKGRNWDHSGWRVKIFWKELLQPFFPKEYIRNIRPLLPGKYSPLKENGDGNEVYFTAISPTLGQLLLDIVDVDNIGATKILDDIKETLEELKIQDTSIKKLPETAKKQLILARVGQGYFRKELEKIESRCRLTNLGDKKFLTASHIKPWRSSTDEEKLDGHNGFLLSPHIDRLFDKGFISFADDGKILTINHDQVDIVLKTWNLDPHINVGKFTTKQKEYLAYHRDVIHKKKIEEFQKNID